MSYKNYKCKNSISGGIFPSHTHLVWEMKTGVYYLANGKSFYKFTNYGLTGTQLDVDPDDSSPDNLSRDRTIQCAWIDRSDNEIWLGDCNNNGSDDQYDVWKIDLTDDSITEIGSYQKAGSAVWVGDIFKYGTGHYVIHFEPTGLVSGSIWTSLVESDPFVLEEKIPLVGEINFDMSFGAIYGSNYFFVWDFENFPTYLEKYNISAKTFTRMHTYSNDWSVPSPISKAMAFDGIDNLYYVLLTGGEPYLQKFQISTTGLTSKGYYNIALMLDRNTSGSNYEKGFEVGGNKIFQIDPSYKYLLNIANIPLNSNQVIRAITDNYLFVSGAQ